MSITIDEEFEILTYSPICDLCAHLNLERGGVDRVCKAFPNGIPLSIWNGDNDHRKPVKGDHGIRFEPIQPTPLRDLVPEKGD